MILSPTEKSDVIHELHARNCSCVIYKQGQLYYFHNKGILDLYTMLSERPDILDGSFVADKVIGKGAAALMCAGNVSEVYSDIISNHALDLLNAYGIPVSFRQQVTNIINRKGDDLCPVEKLCIPHGPDINKCLEDIKHFLETLRGRML